MNTNRSCGCKSFNTCFVCEAELGIAKADAAKLRVEAFEKTYVYCPDTDRLVIQNEAAANSIIQFPGFKLIRDFITADEEEKLLADLDGLPWIASQSGRRKQNFGPKANFKKRKTKVGDFVGFPECTRFVQDRFLTVPMLKDYKTVEQCSIEYRSETGSCIEAHIDDCWIWGERIVQINLLSDSYLTCFPYHADEEEGNKRYNLPDADDYPRVLDDDGKVVFNPFEEDCNGSESYARKKGRDLLDAVVRVPLPRRSLLVMYGEPRYDWEHCVMREDITEERRVVVAYRELTPTYLPGGREEELGAQILEKARLFWT
jgi:alkylated DNA repair protein alkB family protein 4